MTVFTWSKHYIAGWEEHTRKTSSPCVMCEILDSFESASDLLRRRYNELSERVEVQDALIQELQIMIKGQEEQIKALNIQLETATHSHHLATPMNRMDRKCRNDTIRSEIASQFCRSLNNILTPSTPPQRED